MADERLDRLLNLDQLATSWGPPDADVPYPDEDVESTADDTTADPNFKAPPSDGSPSEDEGGDEESDRGSESDGGNLSSIAASSDGCQPLELVRQPGRQGHHAVELWLSSSLQAHQDVGPQKLRCQPLSEALYSEEHRHRRCSPCVAPHVQPPVGYHYEQRSPCPKETLALGLGRLICHQARWLCHHHHPEEKTLLLKQEHLLGRCRPKKTMERRLIESRRYRT
ncbi:hypothetical protein DVH05_003358 [Phytophthora capsici]|nr:hypothetical protein DVH05_003358 [Phytophthora capsici]